MGDVFGGGGEAPEGYFQQPPAFNIPNEELLTGLGAHRASSATPGLTSPWTTAQLGFAEQWTPQMTFQLPQFDMAMLNPQSNPWIHGIPQNTTLGGYQYVPPGANSLYNPQGSFQGLAGMGQQQGPPASSMLPQFNPGQQQGPGPDFNGPYGPGGQQQQQQMPTTQQLPNHPGMG